MINSLLKSLSFVFLVILRLGLLSQNQVFLMHVLSDKTQGGSLLKVVFAMEEVSDNWKLLRLNPLEGTLEGVDVKEFSQFLKKVEKFLVTVKDLELDGSKKTKLIDEFRKKFDQERRSGSFTEITNERTAEDLVKNRRSFLEDVNVFYANLMEPEEGKRIDYKTKLSAIRGKTYVSPLADSLSSLVFDVLRLDAYRNLLNAVGEHDSMYRLGRDLGALIGKFNDEYQSALGKDAHTFTPDTLLKFKKRSIGLRIEIESLRNEISKIPALANKKQLSENFVPDASNEQHVVDNVVQLVKSYNKNDDNTLVQQLMKDLKKENQTPADRSMALSRAYLFLSDPVSMKTDQALKDKIEQYNTLFDQASLDDSEKRIMINYSLQWKSYLKIIKPNDSDRGDVESWNRYWAAQRVYDQMMEKISGNNSDSSSLLKQGVSTLVESFKEEYFEKSVRAREQLGGDVERSSYGARFEEKFSELFEKSSDSLKKGRKKEAKAVEGGEELDSLFADIESESAKKTGISRSKSTSSSPSTKVEDIKIKQILINLRDFLNKVKNDKIKQQLKKSIYENYSELKESFSGEGDDDHANSKTHPLAKSNVNFWVEQWLEALERIPSLYQDDEGKIKDLVEEELGILDYEIKSEKSYSDKLDDKAEAKIIQYVEAINELDDVMGKSHLGRHTAFFGQTEDNARGFFSEFDSTMEKVSSYLVKGEFLDKRGLRKLSKKYRDAQKIYKGVIKKIKEKLESLKDENGLKRKEVLIERVIHSMEKFKVDVESRMKNRSSAGDVKDLLYNFDVEIDGIITHRYDISQSIKMISMGEEEKEKRTIDILKARILADYERLKSLIRASDSENLGLLKKAKAEAEKNRPRMIETPAKRKTHLEELQKYELKLRSLQASIHADKREQKMKKQAAAVAAAKSRVSTSERLGVGLGISAIPRVVVGTRGWSSHPSGPLPLPFSGGRFDDTSGERQDGDSREGVGGSHLLHDWDTTDWDATWQEREDRLFVGGRRGSTDSAGGVGGSPRRSPHDGYPQQHQGLIAGSSYHGERGSPRVEALEFKGGNELLALMQQIEALPSSSHSDKGGSQELQSYREAAARLRTVVQVATAPEVSELDEQSAVLLGDFINRNTAVVNEVLDFVKSANNYLDSLSRADHRAEVVRASRIAAQIADIALENVTSAHRVLVNEEDETIDAIDALVLHAKTEKLEIESMVSKIAKAQSRSAGTRTRTESRSPSPSEHSTKLHRISTMLEKVNVEYDHLWDAGRFVRDDATAKAFVEVVQSYQAVAHAAYMAVVDSYKKPGFTREIATDEYIEQIETAKKNIESCISSLRSFRSRDYENQAQESLRFVSDFSTAAFDYAGKIGMRRSAQVDSLVVPSQERGRSLRRRPRSASSFSPRPAPAAAAAAGLPPTLR